MADVPTGVCDQLCLTLCNPWDCSPPGYSLHAILQARILQWVAMPLPGDLPNSGTDPVSPALQVNSLPLSHWGSPWCSYRTRKPGTEDSPYNGQRVKMAFDRPSREVCNRSFSQKDLMPLIPWVWTSNLQNYETLNSYNLNHPVCDSLL